jgi:PAS domain S-box-containing protein
MAGAVAGQAMAGVAVPVRRGGRVVGMLGTRLESAALSRALAALELNGGAFTTLVDGAGIVVARSVEPEQHVGRPVLAWYGPAVAGRDRGIAQGTAIDGQDVILAFQRLAAAPGWTVVVAEPFAAYRAAWLDPLLGLVAGGAAALTLGIALSAALSRRILRPVFALVRRAEGAGSGRPPFAGRPLPAGVAEFEVLRDATERAEAALRGANRRNAEVLASIGEPLFSLDPGGRVVFVSARALAFWGRPPEEVLGARFDDIFPQAVGSAAWEAKRYAAAQQEEVHLCVISALAHHWIETDIYPRGDGGITVAFRDIEQRRRDHVERARAEAAQRESEERFRLVAESAPVMLWMGDAEGRCLYLNGALREFWGVGPEALDGFDWNTTLHPEDQAGLFAQAGPAMQARGGFAADARYRRADGEYRVLRTVARPRFGPGGAFLGMIGVNADITEAAQAEAALRASEERLRLAQEAGGIGAWELDLTTGRRHWSESNYRLWGVEPGTPVTRELLTTLIHPEDLARSRVGAVEAATVAGPLPELEMRIIRRSDGAVRWMLSCAEAVADASGRTVRHIGIMRDITVQKETIERLALLMRELDHRAKNALAVVSAAIRLTQADDTPSFVRAVEGRVAALARAHTMLAQGQWSGAELRTVVAAELATFLPAADGAGAEGCTGQPRVDVAGPALTISPTAAQALAMTLHELATNATKYGALSTPGGRIGVSWQVGDAEGWLRLRWEESGGPPITGVPARRGFGSRVIEATVKGQLGGKVERRWDAAGLICIIEVPMSRVQAGSVESG